jgi:hypothetical protein
MPQSGLPHGRRPRGATERKVAGPRSLPREEQGCHQAQRLGLSLDVARDDRARCCCTACCCGVAPRCGTALRCGTATRCGTAPCRRHGATLLYGAPWGAIAGA